jgi:phosphoglycolate phosphatase
LANRDSRQLPLVLFDMDGTLLDTRHDIARSANNARKELGLPLLSVDEVVRAVGDGVNLFVSRVTYPENDSRFAAARTIFLRHYAENVTGETKPYEGILEMLDGLHERRVPMALVSNKPEKLVDELVKFFGWQKYFTCWLGGDSATKSKPHPEPLLMALEKSNVRADYPIVVVGDGHQDILAAKSMGCRAIWVSWGFNAEPTTEYPSDRADHPRVILPLLGL